MLPYAPRTVLAASVLCLLAAALVTAPRGAPQGREIEIRAEHVAGPVHALFGQGGNIGVSVGPDGVLMIDDQFEPLAPKIQAALDALAKAPAAPRFLLNTHFHGDHTGGNLVFGERSTVLAHENVRERLLRPGSGPGDRKDPMPARGLPVVTYAQGVALHVNGERVRVAHYPASHTDGDSVVFFEGSKVVHMGDLFFAGRFPFVDIDSGGSVRGLLASIDRVMADLTPEWRVIPGHGPVSTVEDLRAFRAMLDDCLAIVGRALERGETAADLESKRALAKYESWGTGFIRTRAWIDTLVRELATGATERK